MGSRLVAWQLLGWPKRNKRFCVAMKWVSCASTTTSRRVAVPRSFFNQWWQHSFGLVLTLMRKGSVAMLCPTLWCSVGTKSWVVIFAGRSVSGKGSSEHCEEDSRHEGDPAAVVRICLAQLRHKWPSVRVASLLESSVDLTRHACECVSAELNANPVSVNASSVCSLERDRTC